MARPRGGIVFGRAASRHLGVLGVALLLWGLAPSVAQGETPLWRQTLDCASHPQKYSGVEYCTGLGGNAHVLVIDLHQRGVRLEYVIAEGLNRNEVRGECQDVNIPKWSKGPGCYDPLKSGCDDPLKCDYYPVMSLLDAVNRNSGAAAVVNSDYGAGTQDEPKSREHGPEGFAVVQGERIDGLAVTDTDHGAEIRPWLAVGRDAPLRAEFGQFPWGEDDGGKPDWVYTGVGGGPWLIRDGQIAVDEIALCQNCESWSCVNPAAQTAVGLSEDGRWLYWVIVVGRNARDTAQFMHDALRPRQAIKMDGGGSSQLWYGGLPGSGPEEKVAYAGTGRSLSQYIAVFADRGTGITIEPGQEPPDQPGWWKSFWEGIRRQAEQAWEQRKAEFAGWWEDRKAELAEWWKGLLAGFERQREEAIRRFFEELEIRLREFLDQLLREMCGTAMLPGGVALVWWATRRRRD